MLSRVLSAAVHGIAGFPVWVEVDFRFGLPAFSIVGLPDAGVREARDRVVTAIKNSGYSFPAHRVTVNLAPADIKKEGPAFDLPMALGVMAAADLIPPSSLEGFAFMGELGLGGELRPIRGVLSSAMRLKTLGVRGLVVPEANAREAALVEGLSVHPLASLTEVALFLLAEDKPNPYALDRSALFRSASAWPVDFSDVKGQTLAKRALEIAAAGGHNVLLVGPPGSGKTLLSRRLPTILPDLTFEEALETTQIHSVAGLLPPGQAMIATRPFRSPHHQMSDVALIGGGSHPRPGEVSLSHRGVLFLDEFPEFGRSALEALRQPLEDRTVTVVRVASSVTFPSDFLLVAAANPCPCGYLGSSQKTCACTPSQIQRYKSRISGPVMDRIDLHVEVPALPTDDLTSDHAPAEPSSTIRARVREARDKQQQRLAEVGLVENGQMSVRHLKRFCPLSPPARDVLRRAISSFGLSARSYDRILRVSRTVADLGGAETIGVPHVAEALSFRSLDRADFGGKEFQQNP